MASPMPIHNFAKLPEPLAATRAQHHRKGDNEARPVKPLEQEKIIYIAMNYKALWIIVLIGSILITTIFKINFFLSVLIAFAVSYVVLFVVESFRDKQELKQGGLPEKFSTLINFLNDWTYQGNGTIHKIDNYLFNLYKENSCQIIHFFYTADILSITWKFKYYQQEVVYKRDMRNARNTTDEQQAEFAKLIISEFAAKVEAHKRKIDSEGIPERMLSEFGVTPEQLQNARDFLK
jgi:hypothetical protein